MDARVLIELDLTEPLEYLGFTCFFLWLWIGAYYMCSTVAPNGHILNNINSSTQDNYLSTLNILSAENNDLEYLIWHY